MTRTYIIIHSLLWCPFLCKKYECIWFWDAAPDPAGGTTQWTDSICSMLSFQNGKILTSETHFIPRFWLRNSGCILDKIIQVFLFCFFTKSILCENYLFRSYHFHKTGKRKRVRRERCSGDRNGWIEKPITRRKEENMDGKVEKAEESINVFQTTGQYLLWILK